MPDKVGVAVVGLDHWYSAFMILEQIAAEPGLQLIGIADGNAAHLQEVGARFEPLHTYTDPIRLIEEPTVDIVFSLYNSATNVSVCMESLGRGRHTLCVKPPACTVADAVRLAEAADESGVVYSALETWPRLTARSAQLKALIKGGAIGEPISFYQVAHGGLPQPWPEANGSSWWLDRALVPGGAWMDHAIYAVDQLRWTLEREVISVSAVMANRTHSELAVEDYGLAWMQLNGGATAVMEDTWASTHGVHFTRFIGTEGSIEPVERGFMLSAKGHNEEIPSAVSASSQMATLVSAVRGDVRLPFTNWCSVYNLSACLAAYESSRTGRWVAPHRAGA